MIVAFPGVSSLIFPLCVCVFKYLPKSNLRQHIDLTYIFSSYLNYRQFFFSFWHVYCHGSFALPLGVNGRFNLRSCLFLHIFYTISLTMLRFILENWNKSNKTIFLELPTLSLYCSRFYNGQTCFINK